MVPRTRYHRKLGSRIAAQGPTSFIPDCRSEVHFNDKLSQSPLIVAHVQSCSEAMSSSNDQDLLARLNALKPSSVNLKEAPAIDVETASNTIEDKLAARLKSLRSGEKADTSPSKRAREPAPAVEPRAKASDDVASKSDVVLGWHQQESDAQTLDDLLAELGTDTQWKLDPEDPSNVEALLKEAREALPREAQADDAHDAENLSASDQDERQNQAQDHSTEETLKRDDQIDEEEADDYVKRVLDELDYERKHGEDSLDAHSKDGKDQPEEDGGDLDLPGTPSNLPHLAESKELGPPSYEDSELEARFAKLGVSDIDLPSTPTSKPSSSRPKVTASLKPKAGLPKFNDEDIDSWCCICNEDGEVKCLGCDNDIYCQQCWQDGHGTGPGQERGHKAVQYSRKGPAAAA